MGKHLVIVESPAKAKTISKYLGKDYDIKASFGHVRDLPTYTLGVDIENGFEPKYQNIKDKKKVLDEIKKSAKKATDVLLATDPDREGEAIAWHVLEAAEIPAEKAKRVVFHEITRNAVQEAVKSPRDIDTHLVDAQQARRILDRLIGYKLSPILSRKIRKGLSAGRVQSAAVKLICDRERQINAFVPEEYWEIDATLISEKHKKSVVARLFAKGEPSQKIEPKTKAEADAILAALEGKSFAVTDVAKKDVQRNPMPPFITSTLQQDASRKLGWSATKTMVVAQQLYEGLEIDGEAVGLITYMRTDSVRISGEALGAARKLIGDEFGASYLPPSPRAFKSGKNIQDAHEAIRPTMPHFTPAKMVDKLQADQFKLYKLIWDRFVASQMASARLESTTVLIQCGDYLFKVTGQVIVFDGFMKLYLEGRDSAEEEDGELPALAAGDALKRKDVTATQKFTQPPHRFTEASLVKTLEELGIGRPSTYAPTIGTILERKYVQREKRTLFPTELGQMVDEQLGKFFQNIVDASFTAEMENQLDEITEGKHVWQDIVSTFYKPFEKDVANAAEKMEKINTDKPSDEVCEKCSSPMVIKIGRYGEFLACSNYPTCKNTKAIVVSVGVNCPDCGKPIAERHSKRGKLFYGCTGFPACKFASWDKPLASPCPKCKAPILFEKKGKGKTSTVCKKCDYEAVV